MTVKTEKPEVKPDKEAQSKETTPVKPEASAPAPKPEKPITDADVIDMGDMSLEGESAPESAATPKADEKSPEAPSPAGDSHSAKPEAEKKPEPKAEEPKPTEGKKYTLDGKTFDTPEEMAAYAQAKLEKGDDITEILAAATEAKTDKPKTDAEELKEIGEMMFEDPAKALEMMEKRAERKFAERKRVEDDQKARAENSRRLWNDFYSKNPDLKASPEIVQVEFDKILRANPNMSIDEGHRKLAEAARARLIAIADSVRPAKELPDGPAITGESGGAEIERAAPTAQVEDFMSQMKRIRHRG